MHFLEQSRPSKRALSKDLESKEGTNTQCMLVNVHVMHPVTEALHDNLSEALLDSTQDDEKGGLSLSGVAVTSKTVTTAETAKTV